MNSDYLFSLVMSLILVSPIYITTHEVSRGSEDEISTSVFDLSLLSQQCSCQR